MHTLRSLRSRPVRGFSGLLGGALLLSLMAAAPSALADDGGPPPPKRGDNLLGGPKVDDSAGKDDRGFGKDGKPGKQGEQAARRPLAKVRLWMETMRSMDLSAEQREKVDAIVGRFQAARDEFEKTNGEARRALEQTIKENGPETAKGKEARQAMKALAEKAPKPDAYQSEAFAILTPEQQEAFKKRLAEREAAMQERRKGEQAGPDGQRPRGGKPAAGGTPPGQGAAPPSGGGATPPRGSPEGQGGQGGHGQGGQGQGGQGRGKGRPARDGAPATPPPTNDDPMR